jgi:hypothetical protein
MWKGKRMNWTLRALCLLSLGAVQLAGQTPVKPAAAPKTEPSLTTDQELNIRAYIELLRTDVRKNKAQIVGAVMDLDASDAAKFWPVYQEFEAEYVQRFGDGLVALIGEYVNNYSTMTDQVADQLATKLLDLDRERNNLKRQYYQRFKEALGPITAARFLQVENQVERIIDLQIASSLPVVEAPQRSEP